jgi:hypothetical protein
VGLDASHGRDVGDSPFRPANEKQLRRRSESIECRAFRRFGNGRMSLYTPEVRCAGASRNATKVLSSHAPAISPTPLTRHSHCHGDKLSRLAPSYELTLAPLSLRNQEFSEMRTRGAHFAKAIGVQLYLPTVGARSVRKPGALIVLALGATGRQTFRLRANRLLASA